MGIPDIEGEKILPDVVPSIVAELPQTEEAPEISPYRISFAEYKEKECQMNGMTGDNAKATLMILRDVGIYYTSEENYWSKASNVEIKPVARGGDYTVFYRGLAEDSELKEIKYKHLRKSIDIRLFFFTLERERTFYLVAARQDHVDTSKGNFRKKY